MNILVTGGRGYLGKRICSDLCRYTSFNIYVASRSSKPISQLPKVKIIEVNSKTDDLIKILKNIDVVIHLASVDAPTSFNDPLTAIDVNVKWTLKWLIASDKAGVKQFIYFSTIHVYGNSLSGKITEKKLTRPVHPYSITHKSAEDYVLSYNNKDSFKSFVFRLSNSVGFPVGEMLQWNLFVPSLCKSAILNKEILVNSNPLITRDFIAISNVINAVMYFIKNCSNINCGIYNLSSNKSQSLKEITELIQIKTNQLFLYKPEINYLSKEEGKFDRFSIDNSKLKNIGFEFSDDLENEIIGLLKYCNETLL